MQSLNCVPQDTFYLLNREDESYPLDDQSDLKNVATLTNEFNLEYIHCLDKSMNHLLSVAYNNKQRMFILLDPLGLVTWEWKKTANKTQRVLNYPDFEYRHIVNVIYCKTYNCYFALKGDSTLAVLNKDFDEVSNAGDTLRSILCMIYNPVNDELITSGVDGMKVWYLKPTNEAPKNAIRPLSNYKLTLKRDLKISEDWISRIDIDTTNFHLYCCTKSDLFIYDFNGREMRSYRKIHAQFITCCVYSPSAKVVLTGSEDSEIKIWSLNGGYIDTFRGHAKAVTNLILNPYNSNLVLSSSLDGFVKMWSLDVMQCIYELLFFEEGVVWMGLTEDKFLYLASPLKITLWSLSNFVDFWAISRNRINHIKVMEFSDKNARVISCSDDGTIRLFKRENAQLLSTILPIPKADFRAKILGIAYSRSSNTTYILLNDNDIWIYYTKTSPATQIDTWNVFQVQEIKKVLDGDAKSCVPIPKALKLASQSLLQEHRAVDYDFVHLEKPFECTSIAVIESVVVFYNEEGPCSPLTKSLLLLGLENGTIIFCDPFIKGKKYFAFQCDKDPVVGISYDKIRNCVVTKIEQKRVFHIQYWTLPYLDLTNEFYVPKKMNSFARLDDDVIIGFDDGSIDFVELNKLPKETCVKNHILSDAEINELLAKPTKFVHKESVALVDSSDNAKLFLTCSFDGYIKLWSQTRHLLIEVMLDSTLSYASFLNDQCDLLIGWKKHIFYISMNKILPDVAKKLSMQKHKEEQFSEDSIIIEDPWLKNSNSNFIPVEVSLEHYLRPFDVNIKTRYEKHPEEVFEIKPEQTVEDAKALENEYDYENELAMSDISTIPSSLYSTPRISFQHFLPNVDLTIRSAVKKSDIKSYLVEIFSQTMNNQEFSKWDFPQFGTSPGSTPSYTSRSVSPEIQPEKTEPVQAVPEPPTTLPTFGIEDFEIKKRNIKSKEELEKELAQKVKERAPRALETSINDVKIDSKNIAASSKFSRASQLVPTKQEPQDLSKQKYAQRPIVRRQVKKNPIAQREKSQLSVKDITLLEKDELEIEIEKGTRVLEKHETIDTFKSSVAKSRRSSIKSSDVKSTRSLIRRSSQSDSKDSFSTEVKNYPSLITETDDENDETTIKKMNRLRGTTAYIKSQSTPKPGEGDDKPNFKTKSQATLSTIKQDHVPSAESTSLIKVAISEKNSERNTASELTYSEYVSNAESGLALSELKKKQIEKKLPKFDNKELKKISNMFDFFYGQKELPKRAYGFSRKWFENEETEIEENLKENDDKKNNIFAQNFQSESAYFRDKKASTDIVLKNFDNWLQDYERKVATRNERITRAQTKEQELFSESMMKFSEKIAKKNTITIVHKPSIMKKRPHSGVNSNAKPKENIRKSNSATVTRLTTIQERVKSVKFSEKNAKVNSKKSVEKVETAKEEHVIYLQQPYLVSAIEMEEILNEAASRVGSTNKQRSIATVSTIEKEFSECDIESDSSNDMFDENTCEDFKCMFSKTAKASSALTKRKMSSRSSPPKRTSFKFDKPDQRVKSCNADMRMNRTKKAQSENFESSSGFRLSLKSGTHKSTSLSQQDFSENDSNRLKSGVSNKTSYHMERSRVISPLSSVTKASEIKYPEIELEYQIPGYPERYLLPIRFPKLHYKIITSLMRVRSARIQLKRR